MQLLARLEAQARAALPEPVYDYFAGGAGDEVTLAENEEAWRRLWLRPRQLAGVGEADPSIELLGRRLAAPLLLAPVAAQRLLHPDGEVAVATAAAGAGVPFCLSTRATADLAEVAEAAGDGARWFQLYFDPDRDRVARILRRAVEHGYEQVVMTVDLPVAGRRERELRHGPIAMPPGIAVASHLGDGEAAAWTKPPPGGWATLTWDDVDWVAQVTGRPVVLKGVLSPEDARLALEHPVSAIVVSNHGGRQLDGSVPTAVALREVVSAVDGRVPVLVDGGIRSGADVVRALALGAAAVLVGRPYLWGLATGGEPGVREVLDSLIADTARTLALIGAPTPADVAPYHVRPRAWE
jgi:4-hydroxymandelate oxidase